MKVPVLPSGSVYMIFPEASLGKPPPEDDFFADADANPVLDFIVGATAVPVVSPIDVAPSARATAFAFGSDAPAPPTEFT